MSLDDSIVNALIGSREVIAKEYFRFRTYLSMNYNNECNFATLIDDSDSRRLVLLHRSEKKILNCLLMRQTWNIFKNTKKIENLFF